MAEFSAAQKRVIDDVENSHALIVAALHLVSGMRFRLEMGDVFKIDERVQMIVRDGQELVALAGEHRIIPSHVEDEFALATDGNLVEIAGLKKCSAHAVAGLVIEQALSYVRDTGGGSPEEVMLQLQAFDEGNECLNYLLIKIDHDELRELLKSEIARVRKNLGVWRIEGELAASRRGRRKGTKSEKTLDIYAELDKGTQDDDIAAMFGMSIDAVRKVIARRDAENTPT